MSEPESGPRLKELEERWRDDQSPRVFLQLADELRRHGRLTRAIAVLTEGLEQHPDSVSGMVALGRCLLEADDPRRAAEFLERAVERDPAQLVANRLLVESRLRLGDAERAAERLAVCRLLGERDADLEAFEARLLELRRGAAGTAVASAGRAAALRHESPFTLPAPAALPDLSLPAPSVPSRQPFGRLHDPHDAARRIDARLLREGIFLRPEAARAPALAREIFPLHSIGEEVEREAVAAASAPPPAAAEEEPAAEPSWELPAARPTVTLARLYLAQGHLDEAERELAAVLELRPGDVEARSGLLEVGRARAAARTPPAGGGLTRRKIDRLTRMLTRLRAERKRVRGVS